MDIGQKIKVLRAEKGISQQKLADLINKTRTLVSHIEVTSKVNFYTLTEIANALGVSISHFTNESTSDSIAKEDNTEYSSLSEKLKKLERENELLNEIIQNQKEIISQLKERLND
ncbi:MAG: helix-turn-helix domain-containing protein [Flavobacteriales bacterium]